MLDWDKWNQSMWYDKAGSDVTNEHRFNAPADGGEGCFCGWKGAEWADHYAEKVAGAAPLDEADHEDAPEDAPKRGRRSRKLDVADAE